MYVGLNNLGMKTLLKGGRLQNLEVLGANGKLRLPVLFVPREASKTDQLDGVSVAERRVRFSEALSVTTVRDRTNLRAVTYDFFVIRR